MFDFHIIDLFEKDSEELKKLQSSFASARFSPGKMAANTTDKKIEVESADTKNNLEMVVEGTEPNHAYYQHYRKYCHHGQCTDILYPRIERSDIKLATLMNRTTDYIFSKYIEGGFYKEHVDGQMMGPARIRTDYSCTVFINDPEEYDGGELCINVGTEELKYKLKAGQAFVYPTGIRHRVNTVTRGERHVCVFWIESALQDVRMREIYKGIQRIHTKYLDEPNALGLISEECFALEHQILRHFANYR